MYFIIFDDQTKDESRMVDLGIISNEKKRVGKKLFGGSPFIGNKIVVSSESYAQWKRVCIQFHICV